MCDSDHTLARAGSITWQRAYRGTILWQAWHNRLCALPEPIIPTLLVLCARSLLPTSPLILKPSDAWQRLQAKCQCAIPS